MLNLISKTKLIFNQSSMNLHGVEEIQIIHEPDYTELAIIGDFSITLRLFHKGEKDIPINLAVVAPSPPPPVESFPEYPLT